MKQIWELENSKSVVDRLNFLKRVKEIIELKEKVDIPSLEKDYPDSDILKQEKSFVRMLKEKLNKFDVYSQKGTYICSGCRQLVEECCCNENGGDDWTKGLDL